MRDCFQKGRVIILFIPYDLKVYFGMTTYRESDAVFAYHFYRLLQKVLKI